MDNDPFARAGIAEAYLDATLQKVPGLLDVHRMTMLLLSERAPALARILVVGAGGGMELKSLGEAQPGWRLTGVDPSAPMLDLARRTTKAIAERIELVEGTVDTVLSSGFDGATCLLVLHFLNRDARLHLLEQIRRRLKPGSSLVVFHHTSGSGDAERWLSLSAAFSDREGGYSAKALTSGTAMAKGLPLLSGDEEEALLRKAGFCDVQLFYAAFSFRGWTAMVP
jgi:tRNA (cmo5U34)-methyltransferase